MTLGVPWCLGRLPWAPGVPPGSSLGGGPGSKYKGQNVEDPSWNRIKIYVDFDIDFLSFWAPSWVPLGSHVGPFWRLGRPKLVLGPSSNHLIFEKVIFQKKRAPLQPQHENEVQDGPRWHPKRPKIAPRQVQDRLGSIFFPLDFSLRFWIAFGSALVSFWVPKWSPRDYTKLGLGPLGPIQDGLRIVLVRSFLLSCRLGSLFWPSWPPLGVVFGNSWNRFGPLGVIVEPLGACLRVSEVVFGASLVSTESSLLPLFPTFL